MIPPGYRDVDEHVSVAGQVADGLKRLATANASGRPRASGEEL